MERTFVFSLPFTSLRLKEAVIAVVELVEKGGKHIVVTANVDHILRLQRDNEFLKAYKQATYIFADGMPVVLASRILRHPLPERVTGTDLFPAVCKIAADKNYKIFLLGGLEGVAESAAKKLKTHYPSLNIAGSYSPPFGFEHSEEENKHIIELINRVSPHILFIGVGAPKQEKWLYNHLDELDIRVGICVGAAFDFIAGRIKRAPKFMQRLSLEWLWRLIHEPRRLWRRYLYDLRFLFLLLRELRKHKTKRAKCKT